MITRSAKSRWWVVCGGVLRQYQSRTTDPVCGTAYRRSSDLAPHPEMAEGGSDGGGGMEGDGGGHATGVIDLAAAGQRLLTLRAGSLGGGLAEAGTWGRHPGAVCR